MKIDGQKWSWWALTCVIAVWLLWMTLRPNQTVAANLSPLTEAAFERGISSHLLIDLAGNVAVFVPLGVTLTFALQAQPPVRRLLLATLGGAGLSLFIELAQMVVPGRVSALDDWLLNTAGATIGALMAWLCGNQVFSEKPGFSSARLWFVERIRKKIREKLTK